jgi:predicted Zn-dependent protease with MMP-like domain
MSELTVMKLNRKEFDNAVRRAYNRIPEEILNRMENVVITVRRRPSRRLLKEMGYPPNEPILGLYDGVSLPEHSFFTAPPSRPDTIFVFQEPLEEICESLAELEREIEITVVHEIAHFLGISDARLEELGYG